MVIRERVKSKRSAMAVAILLPAAFVLGACAGGSGGSGPSSVSPVSPPPPAPPSPPPPPPPPPFPDQIAEPTAFETREYTATEGLPLIGASAAYAIGATGEGITIAVIDTGTLLDHPDLVNADITAHDVCADTECFGYDADGNPTTMMRQDGDIDAGGHGTLVTGVIAATREDDYTTSADNNTAFGIQGIAYESSIIDIRADSPGSCARTGEDEDCVYSDSALVDAIEYAVANGASVINMSLGGEVDPNPDLENAVRAAADAGVLVVISAGNDGDPATGEGATPNEPAYIAGQDSSQGRVVAVGSIDLDRMISDFSNRAGEDAKSFYLLAPGQGIVSTGLDDDVTFPGDASNDADSVGDYYRISGTSFSAPYVAGALALLLDAFPNLRDRPELALQILLDTADDYVDASLDPITGTAAGEGADAVSGVGIVNLVEAFRPQGQQTLSIGVEPVTLDVALAASGGAFGDWAEASGAFDGLVFQDKYERGFVLEADAVYDLVPNAIPSRLVNLSTRADWAAGESRRVSNGNLSFSWSQAKLKEDPLQPYQEDAPTNYQMRFDFGQSAVEVGQGGSVSSLAPSLSLVNEPGVGNAFSTGGSWAMFSHQTDGGMIMDVFSASHDGLTKSGFKLGRDGTDWAFRFGTAIVSDEDTALGGTLQERFGAEDETAMVAYSFESAWYTDDTWLFSSGVELASVELPGIDARDIWTSRWSLGARRSLGAGQLHLVLAQPRRAETGTLRFSAPVAVDGENGDLIYDTITAGLTPSGRQIDFETRYAFNLPAGWNGEASAIVSTSPNHVADAEDEGALWLRFYTLWD